MNQWINDSMNQFHKFTIEERVRWGDVDAASIIFYGSYIRFFEIAETELFRVRGHAVWKGVRGTRHLAAARTPRVRFPPRARLDDLLEVSVYIGSIGRTSMTTKF